MRGKVMVAILATVASLIGGANTAQAAFISTLPSWNGSESINAFGESNTATYGQTITVGTANVLDSFSFRLRYDGGSGPVVFAAYVAAWDGTKITGPLLYSGSQLSLAISQTNFQTFTITTGGVQLTTGNQYALFFSASNYFDGIDGYAAWGWSSDNDAYTGGRFIFSNNGNDFGSLSTNDWDNFIEGDLAFTASLSDGGNVSATPVPPAAILAVIGAGSFGGLGWLRRRFGRKQDAAEATTAAA